MMSADSDDNDENGVLGPVRWVATSRLTADPERFQFRRGADGDDGTIAGENTVFVAARDGMTGAELEEQFRHTLEGNA